MNLERALRSRESEGVRGRYPCVEADSRKYGKRKTENGKWKMETDHSFTSDGQSTEVDKLSLFNKTIWGWSSTRSCFCSVKER